MSALIEAKGLWKDYATPAGSLAALKGVDLRIEAGELVAVMGPSGSGKSTLMNILGCLDRPTGGTCKLGGCNVSALSDRELAGVRNGQIGFVFQNFNLLPRLSNVANVALPLVYAGVDSVARERRALAMIERVGLGSKAHLFPTQISGGQQQRIAIARALVNNPRVILADEPTGSLDRQTSVEILSIFEKLNAAEGIAIVTVTHDPFVAERARRLLRMIDGTVEFDGPMRIAA